MKAIAVFNRKGGVGKSTLSSNLGAGLSRLGLEVEVYGTDGQMNEMVYMGLDAKDIQKYPNSFLDIIKGELTIEQARYQARENLYIINMRNDHVKAVNEFIGMQPRYDLFFENKVFKGKDHTADIRIFDCGAEINKMNEAVLNYVDYIIAPVQLEFGAVFGIPRLWELLEDLYISTEKIKCIVPMMYDSRSNESKKYLDMLKDNVENPEMITGILSKNVGITRGQSNGRHIYELSKEDQTDEERIKDAQAEMDKIIAKVVETIVE